MLPNERTRRVDRHALVTAAWLPAAFIAAALIHHGLLAGGPVWIMAGFGAILAGFSAHVVVNAVLGTDFSAREVALGLVFHACGAIAIGIAALFGRGAAPGEFLALAGGLALIAAAAVFYMVTRYGIRDAFENFNVIRNFNPRASSRLAHRGGRR